MSKNNGYHFSDFHFYEEILYSTKAGNFFLLKEGGALSCMAENCGNNSTTGSEDIQPLTHDEVIAWLDNQTVTDPEIEQLQKHGIKLVDA